MLFRAFASSGREALLLSEMRVPRCSGYLGHPSALSHFSFPIVQIHRVVFPSSYSLSAQLPRNNQLCSAVRLRPLLQRSTPENGQVLDADTGSLVQREFIQCLVSMAALVQPSKDGLAEQLRSMLMNHLLPLALTNEDQVHAAPPLPLARRFVGAAATLMSMHPKACNDPRPSHKACDSSACLLPHTRFTSDHERPRSWQMRCFSSTPFIARKLRHHGSTKLSPGMP